MRVQSERKRERSVVLSTLATLFRDTDASIMRPRAI